MANASLPGELVSEILSYFRCVHPTSLDGLQVALTCRGLYKEFQPLIAAFHAEQLSKAMTPPAGDESQFEYLKVNIHDDAVNQREFMSPEDFKRRAESAFGRPSLNSLPQMSHEGDPYVEFPDFDVTYNMEAPRPTVDYPPILWSLGSLLSKPHVAVHLRRLVITWLPRRMYSSTPNSAWRTALVSLLQRCVESEGIDLVLRSDPYLSIRYPPPTKGPPPFLKRSTYSNSKISRLRLERAAVSSFWPGHLHALVTHSATTLTRLCFISCRPPSDSWSAVLLHWRLPQLECLEVKDTEIPVNVLVTFLISHPSIISTTVLTRPSSDIENKPIARAEDSPRFLPCLRNLTGTVDFLLVIFNPGSDLYMPHLKSLTVHCHCVDKYMFAPLESLEDNMLTLFFSYLPATLERMRSDGPPLLDKLGLQLPCCSVIKKWLHSTPLLSPPAALSTIGSMESR